MFTKRFTIMVLIGLNVLLLSALLAQVLSLPAVYAQIGGRRGDFVCITAKVATENYDALYILDVPARRLHVLLPTDPQSDLLVPAGSRDLMKDFDRK